MSSRFFKKRGNVSESVSSNNSYSNVWSILNGLLKIIIIALIIYTIWMNNKILNSTTVPEIKKEETPETPETTPSQ